MNNRIFLILAIQNSFLATLEARYCFFEHHIGGQRRFMNTNDGAITRELLDILSEDLSLLKRRIKKLRK